jgi:prepilin-type processing-associated H-X9-DG protein
VDELSEIRNPVDVFVVIEEHPDSINDSLFMFDPGANPREAGYGWRDLPASYHKGGAVGISFADGHSVIHKWKDEGTIQRIRKKNKPWGTNGLSAPGSEDVRWMFDKMPYLERGLENPAASATP